MGQSFRQISYNCRWSTDNSVVSKFHSPLLTLSVPPDRPEQFCPRPHLFPFVLSSCLSSHFARHLVCAVSSFADFAESGFHPDCYGATSVSFPC
ncbi:hypothetical protein V6N13_082364 [Hibiscus sabdariffa]|uniref:Uncharacterized protein n=1 Tax=Hibiscus sabdariffa TaxID=183260 RepID=A0ABR2Q365_9ROSI